MLSVQVLRRSIDAREELHLVYTVAAEVRQEKQVQGISLHDWGDQFLVLLDAPTGEIPYFVGRNEVAQLLADCLKPPELRK